MDTQNQKLLNFPEYWRIVRRRKKYIIIPFLTIASTVCAVSYLLKPVYESSTTLLITGTQLLNQNMERMLPGVTVQQHTAKIIKSKVMSRTNLIELINQMNFKDDAELQEEARQHQKKFPGFTLDEIMDELLLERLMKYVIVENTGIEYVKIKIKNNNPDRAYQMVERLTKIFIENSLKAQLGGLKQVQEFGDEQLEIYQKKLTDAERRLREHEERMKAKQVENFNLSSIDLNHINVMLVSCDMQISETQEKLKQTLARCDSAAAGISITRTPYVAKLAERLNNRSVDLAELLTQFDWKDPKVIRLNNEIIGIKAAMGQELHRMALEQGIPEKHIDMLVQKELLQFEFDSYLQQKNHLRQRLDQYKQLVTSDPSNDIIRQRLLEEIASYREIYKTLIQQRNGSEIKSALQRTEAESQFEIVEPAFRPVKPVNSKRLQLLIIGLGMGLMVGIAIAFILEYLNNAFKNVEDAESYLELVVLGTIPKMEMRVISSKAFNR